MASVRFENVWKLFGDSPVVKDLNLEIQDGEFLVIVGASGCGKTTTLRMLAGLETPSFGKIFIGDEDVTLAKPGQRDIAMVFQSYALYPHMTVYKNLAFGPSVRREKDAQIKARVADVAEVLGLGPLLDRKPSELSGGQRQRVALGRVMIREPRLSLFDEPLSNLDAALRVQMRGEIVRLQRRLQVTTAYVTHDQVEAMTMGDRIALMEHGSLLQVDTPQAMYENPRSVAVASFIGSPKMGFVPAEIERGSTTVVSALGTRFTLDDDRTQFVAATGHLAATLGIRPHDLHYGPDAPPRCTVEVSGRVEAVEPTGSETFATVTVDDERLVARLPRGLSIQPSSSVTLAFDPLDVHLFDAETQRSLLERQTSAIVRTDEA